jgi:malonyl-CoA/methylmalonyl-CoA synthetase
MTDSHEQNLLAKFRTRFPADLGNPLLTTATGECFSYADALDASARIARYLESLGIRRGDRVTVQVEKSPAAVWLYLACLRAGYIFHPLNTDYQRGEIGYFVRDAEPAVVVCDPVKQPLFAGFAAHGSPKILTIDANGEGDLTSGAQDMSADFPIVPAATADTAVLLYSSGTTGAPKGAMLSHGNLAANTVTLVEAWGFKPDDCLLHALPIYHAHGLFVALGCVLASGSRMCFLPRFDADLVVRALPACTVMMGVPTFYTRLLGHAGFDAECCRNVRLFISGSAPLLPETFAAFEQRTGHRILERYGMTETSMNASNPLIGERRSGSVGPALPGIELRAVDDTGACVAPGEIGHLQVRGPNVFAGYWRQPEKTATEFTDDGYFDTGDEAIIAADGYVTIVGRAKDMIISGGLNVYPREVEQALDEFAEIGESAVIGAPHPDFGEGVIAIAVAAAGYTPEPNALLTRLRERLAAYKCPKAMFLVEELPRNAMGKVQKNLLREKYANTFAA